MQSNSSPWSIKEILGSNTSVLFSEEFKRAWFWDADKDGNCKPFSKKGAVYRFSHLFLPFWEFYKFRVGDDGGYLIIQKNKQRVRIIGNDRDNHTSLEIFEWFQDQVPYLKSILGCGRKGSAIPPGFDQEVFAAAELFATRTIAFLPKLPLIEVQSQDGKALKVKQQPLQDNPHQAYLPFENGIVCIDSKSEPEVVPWIHIPTQCFVWDNEVIPYNITLHDHPSGQFWEFLKRLALEEQIGKWLPNPAQQSTITSAFGYLCHNFQRPDQRPCVIFYDRTNQWKSGGNGKSRLCEALEYVRPVHEVSGKHLKKGDNQFAWAGYTPDKRIAVIQDIRAEFEFEHLYNQIEDSFTVEQKGKDKMTIPRDLAPKIAITTNHTVDNQGWSDARRQHLVPIGTFFGTMHRLHNKNIKEYLGKWLYQGWDENDWIDFYNVVIHCIDHYLTEGLVTFKDEVYQDRLMLSATHGNEDMLQVLKAFIQDVVTTQSGVTNRPALLRALDTPELEYPNQSWKGNWQTRCFKRVAEAMGYQINPGRREGRWQQDLNGKVEDFYALVPMENLRPPSEETPTGFQAFLED